MSISPRTCQSSPNSCHSPPALVNLTRVAGGARGAREEGIGARAGGAPFNGRYDSPAQVYQKSQTFSKFLGSSGGRADRGSPRQKTFQVTFKKNLDFFPVSLCRLNPKFTKFLADLPNFLRLYQISCGFPGNLVNFQGGGRGVHVGHLTLSHTSWVKWVCPTGRPEWW